MSQRDTSSEHLRLVLGTAIPGDQVLLLRVSRDGADELRSLLEEEGVYEGSVMEHSAGPDLLIYAGSIAGGLTGLAAVLRVFFHRNQHKSVTFTRGDETIEMKGLSQPETQDIVDRLLAHARDEQLERNAEWERISGNAIEPPEDQETGA